MWPKDQCAVCTCTSKDNMIVIITPQKVKFVLSKVQYTREKIIFNVQLTQNFDEGFGGSWLPMHEHVMQKAYCKSCIKVLFTSSEKHQCFYDYDGQFLASFSIIMGRQRDSNSNNQSRGLAQRSFERVMSSLVGWRRLTRLL